MLVVKRRKTLGAELHTETLADPLLGSNPKPDTTQQALSYLKCLSECCSLKVGIITVCEYLLSQTLSSRQNGTVWMSGGGKGSSDY